MSFRYRSHQLQEIVLAAKLVREGQSLTFRNYKDHGKHLELELDLKDGPLVNLRLTVTAGRYDEPETYRAALLLDDQRIRGVDHADIETKRFYKTAVPKGWHQNVIDPNLPTREINRHVSLPHFEVGDLTDFLAKVAELWHVEMASEEVLL
ncbi:MAG: hypothetical protein JWO95_605 [Verrucomicrobiales bacterium]|nr:hypothetical protein [Verrucomicrobiales bacterium]